MTLKQVALKLLYPVFIRLSRLLRRDPGIMINEGNISPNTSFHALSGTLINGNRFNFNHLQGKKVLLVNVASDCGYTPQYAELEKLNQAYKEKVIILGFPSNDFKGQEPGNGEDIERFCQLNYSVSFTLFQKQSVQEPGHDTIFQWLCRKKYNGWNDDAPSWNFCKYLVDENGRLQAVFQPHVSPLSEAVLKQISNTSTFQ